jgi:RNA polymerase sigma-70 factor (ECF subfamily)
MIDKYSPEEELAFQETKLKYESTLENLSEKQREVFLMSRMEGLKYQEIAERLQLSVKAVEKRMTGALAAFRKALLK